MDLDFYDKEGAVEKVITARIGPGGDFHEEVQRLIEKYDIQYGYIPSAIGMFEKCTLGIMGENMEYSERDFDNVEYMLNGSIFQREGKPFVHVHATVGGVGNDAFVGHLAKGKIKVMCEITIVFA
ncbi:MAG: PPC domain-containing DNA-binding protein [Patescibacteria group bacterium]|nr:DNA-binding protein [Patescibacteria group bacterium]